MAVKYFDVPDVGRVSMYRRKGVKGVRMSVAHDGSVRVTLPTWAPYRLGVEFVRSKTDWISQKRIPRRTIRNGDRVGKAHRFVFVPVKGTARTTTKLAGTDIKVRMPADLEVESDQIQEAAEKAAVRALKKEAEQLLPQRLEALAAQHGFTYNSVSVKRLKSRWGSCNERKDIVLNLFLMQLPWHLIDYVLLHELTHTRILRHGTPFWVELGKYVRDLKATRKEIKTHQPTLITQPGPVFEDTVSSQLQVAVETL